MVDYKYAEMYTQDSVDKQVKIKYDGGVITNEELFSESVELTESLCSESELRFGCCEASALKFKVANIMIPLSGKWLSVSETLAGNTDVAFSFGRYKVYSDKPTADRRYRDVVAYDAMYDIINADVADWYNTILPDKTSTVTLKQFRTSFIAHFGLEQEEIELVNDDMIVEKTIEPSEISGKDVITAICELNGCFGHIGRDGKFHYVFLPKYIEGLYPADDLYPADNLYPRDSSATKIGNHLYISCKYEDFVTHKIDKLQIRQEENDIGAIIGTGSNCYIVEDNFLVYGKSAKDLESVANNLFGVITEISYRPFETECKGNPCLEVGDAVRLATKYEIVESYILKRTLKGIQALRDTYTAEGVEEYAEKVNSVNKLITQLKGKTNTLERTVEMTRSEIKDVENGLASTITQTAEEIRSEIEDTKNGLQSSIEQTAESIKSEVSSTYETKGESKTAYNELKSSITQTANEIRSEVSETYQTQADAESTYSVFESSLSQTAFEISSKVSKDNVVSEINQSAEGIKISAELLELTGRMEITGGYIHIVADESTDNLIEFKRNGTLVQMGTDGMRSADTARGRVATFQYSNVTVTNGDLIAQLRDDGKGISSYGWESYSDRRLKHDIKEMDIEERAAFIYALKACSYKYNYDPDGHIRHGFIAQEVKEAIGNEDWAIVGENVSSNGETYLTLDKLELIADLVATVQLQNKQIAELVDRVAKLEEK